MFVQLTKDILGRKTGERIDVSDAEGNDLIAKGYAGPVNDDLVTPAVTKALESTFGKFSQAIDSIVDATVKRVADAQGKSRKNAIPAIFGENGEGDPKKTFGNFLLAIRRGDAKALEAMGSHFVESGNRKAAMNTQAGTQGGYTVPTEFVPELLALSAENAIVEPLSMNVPMESQVVEIPALDHTTAPTAGETAFFGGVQANWTEEAAAMGEEEPTFKQVRLVAHELSGFSYISNTLVQDNAVGLEAVLKRIFGGAIGWHKDYAYLRGTGAGKPTGVLNWPGLISVTRSAASAFALADAAGMLARLLRSGNESSICWVVHPTVLAKLYTMVSSAVGGGTVYIDNARQKPTLMLLGYPVKVTEKVPALNTLGDVLLCDFGLYLTGQRQEIEIAFSEHYRFTNNQGTWRFVTRVDGRPWMNDKVTLADASSTLSPFVGLAAG